MRTVTVLEAKTHLSRLLQRVAAGEEIVIARRDRPIARLQIERLTLVSADRQFADYDVEVL